MSSPHASRLVSATAVAAVAIVAGFGVDGFAGGIIAVAGALAAILVADSGRDPAPAFVPPEPIPAPRLILGEVLDAIVEPVLLVRAGRVTLANRAAEALLGGHIVGEDARLAIRHPAAAERLAADTAPTDRPIELVGLGTRDQRWEMRVGATSDGQRIVHLIDQTGNYAAERMRVDFVANASHELRTPLASILGFIETLGDEAGEDAGIRARFLKVMFDEAQRMQRLIDDLISLSRIEAEKYRLPDTAIDLGTLVIDVRAEIADSARARGHDVTATIAPDLPPVAGDRTQLSQVLHNLIGNALKYGRADSSVAIELHRDASGMVRLSVRDEGDGIAPHHIPRLTERFYRADAGRSRSLGGTGLGLAIVKHIVERHRGRLDIASRQGIGTTVTVILPAAAEPLSSKSNTNVTQTAS